MSINYVKPQKTVKRFLAKGVVGEFYDASIRKTRTFVLGTTGYVGRIHTSADGKNAVLGGTGAIVGVLTGGKQLTKVGLGESGEVAKGVSAQFSKFCHVWVKPGTNVAFGGKLQYNKTTGVISAPTGATADEGCVLLDKASVIEGCTGAAVTQTGATGYGDTLAAIELAY